MPLKSLYLNHNTHMLNYIRYLLNDENDKETPFEKNFLIANMEEIRKRFCKKMNLEYNESNEIEIENIIKKEIEGDEFVIKKNENDLIGDRSYNMSDIYSFRHLIYFEYLSLFLRRNTTLKEI